MIHSGENLVRGVPVTVTRRRARRINIRVSADGRVGLTVPYHWATLAEAEAFLLSKWDWVEKTRRAAQANPAPAKTPVAAAERALLEALLGELHAAWCRRLGEAGVAWKLRAMKSIWGSCHWRKRLVTYNTELARQPRDLVEYVVAHELTHLQAHDHGPRFQELMDARLPDWRARRSRLNHPKPPASRAGAENRPPSAPKVLVQAEFDFS